MTIVGDDDEDVEMIQFKSFYIIRTFYLQFTKLQNTDAMLQMRWGVITLWEDFIRLVDGLRCMQWEGLCEVCHVCQLGVWGGVV